LEGPEATRRFRRVGRAAGDGVKRPGLVQRGDCSTRHVIDYPPTYAVCVACCVQARSSCGACCLTRWTLDSCFSRLTPAPRCVHARHRQGRLRPSHPRFTTRIRSRLQRENPHLSAQHPVASCSSGAQDIALSRHHLWHATRAHVCPPARPPMLNVSRAS
jgi:hypothetical protein